MHGLGVGHLNDPTCGLNGGPPSGSPLNELLVNLQVVFHSMVGEHNL